MPRLQYITVRETDLGAGIDQQSAENRIPEGYCEDIENADPQSTGHIAKRKGYQGYAGYIPVRVKEVVYNTTSTDNIELILDNSIELPSNRSQPLIVLGKSSSANTSNTGDFTSTESIHYYAGYKADIRVTFDTANTPIVILGTDHNIATEFLAIGIGDSTSEVNNSYTDIEVDSITIDKTTKNVTITYTNTTGSDFEGFVWIKDKSTAAGTSYAGSTTTIGGTEAIPIGSSTHTIAGTLSNLNNTNLSVRVYKDTGTELVQDFLPDAITLDENTGDVSVTFTSVLTAFTAVFIVDSNPTANFATGSVPSGGTITVPINTSVAGGTDFANIVCYLETETPDVLEQIMPDTVVNDSTNNLISVRFTNNTGVGANFEVYWDFVTIDTNSLIVTGSVPATGYTDTEPQLTIWGLCHEEIYGDKVAREGWTTHIDSYRAPAENRLISGLGGNLFAARLRSEASNATDYLMPLVYPRLQARLDSDIIIGPAFYSLSATPSRTRGFIKGDNGGVNTFSITSITYNSSTGYVDYLLTIPGMLILESDGVTPTTIDEVISTTFGLEDNFTATQCGYSQHNGTFKIQSVASTATTLTISVENSLIDAADYDETDVGGFGGIFTDQLTFVGSVPFIADDRLTSALFSASLDINCVRSNGTAGELTLQTQTISGTVSLLADSIRIADGETVTVTGTLTTTPGNTAMIDGITTSISLPSGLRVVGERTSSLIPTRDFEVQPEVDNIVRGDMLAYTGINRQLRVKSVNTLNNVGVTIVGSGATTTFTLGQEAVTDTLFVGKQVLITGSNSFTGTQTIADITSATSFTVNTGITSVAVSITADGTTGTATVAPFRASTIAELSVGDVVTIAGTTNYNASHIVTAIPTSLSFEFSTTRTTSESGVIAETGTLEGKVIEVDESLAIADSTDSSKQLFVHSRWIPIESPTDNFDATPKTRIRYFDTNLYDQQEIIRSTMVQDNLYLTNDDDEVMKFDGTNIYRAGLFRWQPNLFVTTDTTVAGKIELDNVAIGVTGLDGTTQFKVAEGDENRFSPGELLYHDDDNKFYTVDNIHVKGASGHIAVTSPISGAGSGSIYEASIFKYYFRLNAIDANDNIVASAVTGANDFVVQLGVDAAVNIRLVGMPLWDIYDYDRLEVQIYRTQANGTTFHLLTTLAMDFDANAGYIDYTDADSDFSLTDATLDATMTALKGIELGTALTQPMRAKYCTSAGNRLVLGNLKDYPQLDMRLLKASQTAELVDSTFTNASNNTWLFRKDNTDTATDTDMINRAKYVFTAAGASGTTITGVSTSAGTSITYTTATPPAVGDWVYVYHEQSADADSVGASGWYLVDSATAGNFTVLEDNAPSSLTGNFPNKFITNASGDIPVPMGTDGNYAQFNGNTDVSSSLFLSMRRLADAINCTMRKAQGITGFAPWMTANAGSEYNVGQLVVRQPKLFSTSMEVVVPALTGDFSVFVNNIKRSGGDNAGAIARLFPSRIIASYANFPEVFDNPTATSDLDSDSAIDINSADGQEITAIIPFFGDAAFGAAQKSGIVVVFKTNSIYLVDLAAKDAGLNAVQRLETRGKGCTAPYSVSVTRGGIMFANDTGVYRLNRNLSVDYIGRKYERKFRDTVNKDQLALATGHHDTEANSYKLSYPQTGETENSTVAVYNHTREYEQKGDGSWTTYTNHPTTGWTNLEANSYFASTSGRVFIIRKLNETSDFRDDASAIAMAITTRALDSLDSGRRKVHSKIITHYRVPSQSDGTALLAALDLKTVFQETDAFKINVESQDGLGDSGNQKVISIVSVIDNKVGVYIQLKYTNSTIDEAVEITGIDFRIAAKSDEGILEARETTA